MRQIECPKCHEPMFVVEFEGIEIDTCPSCEGVWLDGGELEALVGTPPPAKERPDQDLGPPTLDCPICVDKLVKDRYAGTGVVVDKCPHGDGIWLDRGELEQILKALAPSPDAKAHEEAGAAALAKVFKKEAQPADLETPSGESA